MVKSLYKIWRKNYLRVYIRVCHLLTSINFFLNGIESKSFTSVGCPLLDVHPNGVCKFGENLNMVNNAKFATLGKSNQCKIVVSSGGKLLIGNKVAMSNTTIVATLSIILGNNIMIGGGVTIVDSDFHSFNPTHWHTKADELNMKSLPVIINDNVFIGMNVIILKGVVIGSNVIIAAGSIITKNIPDNQIWGGNPARFIMNNTF